MNTDRLEAGTIRILNQHGSTAGTGFIASRQLAVTCAHVVKAAGAKPGDSLTVQFHLNKQTAQVEVLAEGWYQDDLALLSIKGTLPEGIQPIPMRSCRGSVGDEYHAFGYPEDGPVEERRPLGKILGQVHIHGFEHTLIQVDGKYIDKGLSGAPAVVTDGELIGMFTAYRDLDREPGAESARLAYLISTDTIWNTAPELRPSPTLFASRHPLLEGIDQLPFGYASRIQNFLTEYLGTKERPEPFGGREESLAELDRWLELSDEPYLLLTAPAGRGKSALLVRWLARLQSRSDLSIAFVPASVRFNTNLGSVFFASLAARLAFLTGEPVPTQAETDWLGFAASYLSRALPDGRPLLLVLDALDEAGDWEAGRDLLPLDPTDGLRIVVSARSDKPQEWLRRLGWQGKRLSHTVDLDPLSKDGVRDVLERMGFPLDYLSRQVDIVYELHRLSEGDPLLVHFYVEDLWNEGEEAIRLKPEDLLSKKPGYETYFEDWWDDQRKLWGGEALVREQNARAVLNLLAVALGSLRSEDMCALDTSLDGWEVVNALTTLKRIVIGNEEQGYTFGHPKLREFFLGKLTHNEKHQLETCFLTWGRQILADVLDEKLTPKEVPPYLVQHLGMHFQNAKVPLSDFMRLVEKRWADACYELEGAYGSFLQDVLRARAVCMRLYEETIKRGQGVFYLIDEIRCGLVEASLHSLAGNLDPKLLAFLVKFGIWSPSQSLVAVQQKEKPEEKSNALVHILPILPDKFIGPFISITRGIQDEGSRAKVLSALVARLPEGERREVLIEALATVRAIQDEESRARLLSGLMEWLSEAQRREVLVEALTTARAIQKKEAQAVVLNLLAEWLPEKQRREILEEALATAFAIKDEKSRVEAVSALTNKLPEKQRKEVLVEALATVRTIQDDRSRTEALIALAERLPEEQMEEALEAAHELRDERNQTKVLIALAKRLPEKQRRDLLEEVLAASRTTLYDESLVEAMITLAEQLPSLQRREMLRGALAASRRILYEESRVKALIALAERLPEEQMEEALEAAHELRDERNQTKVLIALVERLPAKHRKEVLEEVLKVSQSIQDKQHQTNLLNAMARRLANKQSEEELAVAHKLQDARSRTELLNASTKRLSEKQRREMPFRALEPTRGIQDKGIRAEVLLAQAKRMPNDQRKELLGEALPIVRSLRDEWSRAELLTSLAELLPEELREEILEETLADARSIQDQGYRAEILSALAKWFPEIQRILILGEALAAACTIRDEEHLPKVLIILAKRLHEQQLEEALSAARQLQDKRSRAEVSIALAERMTEVRRWDVLEEALTITCGIQDKLSRAEVLRSLTERIPEGRLGEAVASTRTIQDEQSRAEVLKSLLDRLPTEQLGVVITAVYYIQDEESRAEVLSKLSQKLTEFVYSTKLLFWHLILPLLSSQKRSGMLSDMTAMLPFLQMLGDENTLIQIRQCFEEVCAWWA